MRAAIHQAHTIMAASRAIDRMTSHGWTALSDMRLSIMNGLRNGTWLRATTQPDRMSSMPVEAYTAIR